MLPFTSLSFWNWQRNEYTAIQPDLTDVNFSEMNLHGADASRSMACVTVVRSPGWRATLAKAFSSLRSVDTRRYISHVQLYNFFARVHPRIGDVARDVQRIIWPDLLSGLAISPGRCILS
jgi:hypothetical protein